MNTLLGMQAAVNRQDWNGEPANGWYSDQCLTIEEALLGYFKNAAWSSGKEEQAGEIAPGKWADLTVFSEDLTQISKNRIKDVKIEMTIIDGEIVFQRN